jgi:hypothetical protein
MTMNASSETHRDPSASGSDSRDGGIAVVRSGRSSRSDGPRALASTADDGTTGVPAGGCRSVGYSPEDSACDADHGHGRGRPGDTGTGAGVDPGSGDSGAAATTVAPDETEQRSDNQ